MRSSISRSTIHLAVLGTSLLLGLSCTPVPATGPTQPATSAAAPAATPAPAPEAPVALTLAMEVDANAPHALNMADAAQECPTGSPAGQPLVEPPAIRPKDDELATMLNVQTLDRCVPIWTPKSGNTPGKWTWAKRSLRTYGYPKADVVKPNPRNVADWEWGAPGPTFYLDKESAPGAADGTRFSMKLYNRMRAEGSNSECNKYDHPGSTRGAFPNCFHGDNTTNFHFHGFHISPQKPQDYVSIAILPPKEDGTCESGPSAHGETACGEFEYRLDRIPWDQSEGTHWYHAHKHGSTGLQLLNGLSGTFIIRGPFDRALAKYFTDRNVKLTDKVMVYQQIDQNLPFSRDANSRRPQIPLINGQANPVVTMKKGEVQRWRLIGATMQDAAKIRLSFADYAEVRQIAADGVPFSPESYRDQPFLFKVDAGKAVGLQLDPGYRIDLLVKAKRDIKSGDYIVYANADGNVTEDAAAFVETREDEIADAMKIPKKERQEGVPFITLRIAEADGTTGEATSNDVPFPSPAQWPKLQTTFEDIQITTQSPRETVTYSMEGQAAQDRIMFFINNTQFDHHCANQTLKVGEAVQWTLQNTSGIAHPFHIHVNPFQLASITVAPGKFGTVTFDGTDASPRPWRDTISIPVAFNDLVCAPKKQGENCGNTTANGRNYEHYDKYAKCIDNAFGLATTGGKSWVFNVEWIGQVITTCTQLAQSACKSDAKCAALSPVPAAQPGKVVINQLARTFTGGFVQHCHILGHEDRGMMLGVQSVCPDGKWAAPKADGTAECVDGNGRKDPLPACQLAK